MKFRLIIKAFIVLLFSLLFISQAFPQAGITVSPSRIYYRQSSGSSAAQNIVVTNPNNKELEVGVSVSDWDYDTLGNNRIYDAGTLKTSCANWIQVLPGSYFTLLPNERRELTVSFHVPADADTSVPVHTAMLYVTQLNPGEVSAGNGAAIKVSVRMGVKIYHTFSQLNDRNLEVANFRDITTDDKTKAGSYLELTLNNTGKIWLEGKIKWELMNNQTGGKIKLSSQDFYSLPGNRRLVKKRLPEDLKKGLYTATALINYGDKDELKVAELEFEH